MCPENNNSFDNAYLQKIEPILNPDELENLSPISQVEAVVPHVSEIVLIKRELITPDPNQVRKSFSRRLFM